MGEAVCTVAAGEAVCTVVEAVCAVAEVACMSAAAPCLSVAREGVCASAAAGSAVLKRALALAELAQ